MHEKKNDYSLSLPPSSSSPFNKFVITYIFVSVLIACKMCWCAFERTVPRICSLLHEIYSCNYDGRRISRLENDKLPLQCPRTRRSVGRCSFENHTETIKWNCCSRHEIDGDKHMYSHIYSLAIRDSFCNF